MDGESLDVHGAILADIETRLARIEEKLDTMMPQTRVMHNHVCNVEHVAKSFPFLSNLFSWHKRPRPHILLHEETRMLNWKNV